MMAGDIGNVNYIAKKRTSPASRRWQIIPGNGYSDTKKLRPRPTAITGAGETARYMAVKPQLEKRIPCAFVLARTPLRVDAIMTQLLMPRRDTIAANLTNPLDGDWSTLTRHEVRVL